MKTEAWAKLWLSGVENNMDERLNKIRKQVVDLTKRYERIVYHSISDNNHKIVCQQHPHQKVLRRRWLQKQQHHPRLQITITFTTTTAMTFVLLLYQLLLLLLPILLLPVKGLSFKMPKKKRSFKINSPKYTHKTQYFKILKFVYSFIIFILE